MNKLNTYEDLKLSEYYILDNKQIGLLVDKEVVENLICMTFLLVFDPHKRYYYYNMPVDYLKIYLKPIDKNKVRDWLMVENI